MHPKCAAYLELTKPRIVTLVLVTSAIGFLLGNRYVHTFGTSTLFNSGTIELDKASGFPFLLLFFTLIGTALSCGGAAVLNHYLERDIDGLMHRTKKRPLPTGAVSPAEALGFGTLLVLLGTVLLVYKVNLLTGFLSLLTAFLYVLVYTPLKRITWLNTFVGAIPGALPPMGGWAAATGNVGLGAWMLFLILFVWQHPHFYSIAWMYREDYERGGFKMLPVVEPDGVSTFRQIVVYLIILIPVSLLPTFIGMSGTVYFVGTALLGLLLLAQGVKLRDSRSMQDARRLLQGTVFYLPILLALILSDVAF